MKPSTKPGRGTRTRRNSSAETKARVLQAAIREFSERGFDGARVDQIAQRAGANKFSVYAYFSSKDELFRAVLERTYETFRSHQTDAEFGEMEPQRALERFVRSTFAAFEAVPEIIPLAASENLHEAQHLKSTPRILALYATLHENLAGLLARGEAAGTFRKGLDPVELYLFISALTAHHMTHRHSLGALFGVDLMNPIRRQNRFELIVETIMRTVLAKPAAEQVSP